MTETADAYRKKLAGLDEAERARRDREGKLREILDGIEAATENEIRHLETFMGGEEARLAMEILRRSGGEPILLFECEAMMWALFGPYGHDRFFFGPKGIVRSATSDGRYGSHVTVRKAVRIYVDSMYKPDYWYWDRRGLLGFVSKRAHMRKKLAWAEPSILERIVGLAERCVAIVDRHVRAR